MRIFALPKTPVVRYTKIADYSLFDSARRPEHELKLTFDAKTRKLLKAEVLDEQSK